MRGIFLLPWMVGTWCGGLGAQVSRAPEPLSAWPYFKEIAMPMAGAGLRDFVLDREMLDKARADQADVRLYNGGVEIPYVLRVRREVETQEAFTAREFNRSAEDGAAQVSYDLGESPVEHNEVDIQTSGNDFRRLAEVQGSSDGAQWSTLVSGVILFRFTAGGRTVEQQGVAYPVSRYRYLRIRVNRDPQADRSAPELKGVQIRRSVHRKGELASFAEGPLGREPDRVNGRPASVWRRDLLGRVPLDRVVITTSDGSFSRPFQLEGIDDPASPVLLASGELVKREESSPQLAIAFPEQFARRLKLTVTDDRNPPLAIGAFTAQSAARQVIFEAASAGTGPIRVYYGNAKAAAPHYDLAARLGKDLSVTPVRLMLGEQRDNPTYSPEPRPFSERFPWLVYVVLCSAAAVLAGILLSLVRESGKRAAAI